MSNAPPGETKPEEPKGLIAKLGAALPIGLTAIATVFGLGALAIAARRAGAAPVSR